MPAPTPDQQKISKLITKFRGISQYQNIATVLMDHAVDLLNCMVSSAGFLEKFRAPLALVTGGPVLGGTLYGYIDSMFMFSQGNGTRQLFINAGPWLAYYTDLENGLPLILTAIATNPLYNNARTRYISSNNLLFGANGQIVWKWDGANLLNWGLPKPDAPPTLGWTVPITNITRAGGLLTVVFSAAALPVIQQLCLLSGMVGNLATIAGVAGDPTMNGNWAISAAPGAYQYTLTAPGANAGTFLNDGTITIFSVPCSDRGGLIGLQINTVQRFNGVAFISTISGVAGPNDAVICQNANELVTVSGLTGAAASFNGTYPCIGGFGFAGSVFFNQLGPDIFIGSPTGPGSASGGFSDSVSPRTWRMSWAVSTTGEEGPASDPSIFIPNAVGGLVTNERALLTIPPPPAGYGIDSFFLYATEDGGGTWNTVIGPGSVANPTDESWPIAGIGLPVGPAIPTLISDGFADSQLDAAFQANYINYPPPQDARFLQKFQGRIFVGGMLSAPQDIVYSGYDQIYRGRPETSYPPFNRIRLAIGADKLAGFGVLLNGVIAWDISDKMYMFSGTIQDITTTQPVQIADQLEEEPWQTGLSSAESVQSTPKGVVWVGSDMSVHIWNGIFYGEIIGPRDLSINFSPYMKRITPSRRPFIQSAYFNWLERDWYVLSVAVDGSLTNNRLFFFDLSAEGADNLGIWVSNFACDSICVKEDSSGTRTLVASIAGKISKLYLSSAAVNGVHTNITATTAQVDAFWDSGYWQDEPHTSKMFRYGRLTTDQGGFNLISTVLNDETTTFSIPNPPRQQLKLTPGGRFAVNRRGRRQKFTIVFPRADVDASVIELYTTAIPLADI